MMTQFNAPDIPEMTKLTSTRPESTAFTCDHERGRSAATRESELFTLRHHLSECAEEPIPQQQGLHWKQDKRFRPLLEAFGRALEHAQVNGTLGDSSQQRGAAAVQARIRRRTFVLATSEGFESVFQIKPAVPQRCRWAPS